jgi:hypothetical protein
MPIPRRLDIELAASKIWEYLIWNTTIKVCYGAFINSIAGPLA